MVHLINGFQDETISIENKLLAIAAGLNGLMHLYNNGFEGHGDLKPSNLLFENWVKKFRLEGEQYRTGLWPSADYPWMIKIADFGWSDIWRDLGLTGKALREYLAPERLDGEFKAKSSDMFAMGIIAYELLTGEHPARNLKKAKKSEGNWRRCVQSAAWDLDGLPQGRILQVVKDALSPDPAVRPSPEQFLNELCDELEATHGIKKVSFVLEYYRNQSSELDDIDQLCWAAENSNRLGELERKRSLRKLETAIHHLHVDDLNACQKWGKLANTTIYLLEYQGDKSSKIKIESLRTKADQLLTSFFAETDLRTLKFLEERKDWERFRTYELFTAILGQLALASNTTYKSEKAKSDRLAPLTLSALAFSGAQNCRGDRERCEELLSEAIRQSPEQPEPHYFRALWTKQWLIVLKARKCDDTDLLQELTDRSRSDLVKANELAPNWKEAKSEISQFESVVKAIDRS